MKNIFKTIGLLALLLLVIALVAEPTVAHAQAAGGAGADSTKETLTKIQDVLTMGLNFLLVLFWPILLLIGGLMSNDIIFGAGMEERLLSIWVIVRNFINIAFVVVLVAVALYNVLGIGGGESNLAIKKVLPKIIIGLILVNFSFFFSKVILDATSVLTTSFAAIPGQIDERYENILAMPFETKSDGTVVTVEQAMCDGTRKNNPQLPALCEDNQLKESISVPDFGSGTDGARTEFAVKEFFQKYGAKNAAFAMAVNFMKITKPRFAENLRITTIGELLTNTIFSIVMFIIFGIAIVALFIVLLARAIVLWVAIALSPAAIFLMLFKDELGFLGTGDADIKEKFVQHAIAPATISLVMSIGFLMIDAFKGTNLLGGMTGMEIATASPGDVPITGFKFLHDLLIGVAAAGIVWMGVFAAAKKTVAQGVIGTIETTVGGGLKWAATAPLKYTPWIPTKKSGTAGGHQKASPAALMSAFHQVKHQKEAGARKQAETLFPGLFKPGYNDAKDTVRQAGPDLAKNKEFLKANHRLIIETPDLQKDLAKNLENRLKGSSVDSLWKRMAEQGNLHESELEQIWQAIGGEGSLSAQAAAAQPTASGQPPAAPSAQEVPTPADVAGAGAPTKYTEQGVTKELGEAIKKLDSDMVGAWTSLKKGADGKADTASNLSFAQALRAAQDALKQGKPLAEAQPALDMLAGNDQMNEALWGALKAKTSDSSVQQYIQTKMAPPQPPQTPPPPATP